MIGYISGKIIHISEGSVLVVSQWGIGYEIAINEPTFAKIYAQEEVDLYIYHHISEATQALYGFLNIEDKKIFLELIKISGVGGKVALSLLSLGTDYIIQSVQNEDKAAIEQIKWIWKKMAEKIILELKDKDFVKAKIVTQSKTTSQTTLSSSLLENIKQTLGDMGYRPRDIERVFSLLPDDINSPEQILSFAIKELS